MKILIYASSMGHSTRRLMEEIEKAAKRNPQDNISGEAVSVYDLHAYISERAGYDRIYKRTPDRSERMKVKEYSAIIPRIAGASFEFGSLMVRHLSQNMGIFTTATENGLRICSNKFLTCQVLSANRIRTPKQIFCHQPNDHKEIVDLLGGWPVVGKLQHGSQGAGVFLLEGALSGSTTLRALERTGNDVTLSRFVDTKKTDKDVHSDVRVIVIGAETAEPKLFHYRRFAVAEDFRSNYSISGQGEKCAITEEEKQMCITAARVMGLGVAGCDIMRDATDNGRPLMIEVNGSPSFSGIEKVTGENVAGAVVQYVIDNCRKKQPQQTNSSQTTQQQKKEPFSGNKPYKPAEITLSENDLKLFELVRKNR